MAGAKDLEQDLLSEVLRVGRRAHPTTDKAAQFLGEGDDAFGKKNRSLRWVRSWLAGFDDCGDEPIAEVFSCPQVHLGRSGFDDRPGFVLGGEANVDKPGGLEPSVQAFDGLGAGDAAGKQRGILAQFRRQRRTGHDVG